jgi:PadR family transcriptional regulator PadR
MAEGKYVGGLEELVLTLVHRIGSDAYGLSVHDELQKAGRKISIGSLYTTLGRLEAKGYLTSIDKDASKLRGGRPKRVYKLTGLGVKALNDADEVRNAVRGGVVGAIPWKT